MISDALRHSQRWGSLPERGSPQLVRLLQWIATRLGRPVARCFLPLICVYFFCVARRAREASRDFLTRVHRRPARFWQILRHFHVFASTILDRVYLLRGDFGQFQVTLHQRELLHDQVESGRGAILLGSHLGSFEILRTLGVSYASFPLKVLMDIRHNKNISRFFDDLNDEIARTVIEPDRPDTLLRVKESLEAGFLIGTLGDRPTSDGKTVQCDFLGAPATFPAGPMLLAGVMHCPVILFFGIFRGGNRYEIFFERLTDEVVLHRETRASDLQRWTQAYVARLDHYARLAPENWFNFYSFWDPSDRSGGTP